MRSIAIAAAVAFCGLGHARATGGQIVPACMIIDDGAPFFFMRWVKDKTVCREIPTEFYRQLGQWAAENGIKGKLSVIPCLGGIKPIDGSLGEYPGHSRQERLAWIRMINSLFAPRFTLTPEVITHWYPWDIRGKKLISGAPLENTWLAQQPVDVQAEYIAEAMRMLTRAGIPVGGLTMCWSYPQEKNHVLGQATLRAAREVCGLDYVIVFNDTGLKPGVIYQSGDGGMVVSLRPGVGDVYDHTFGKKTEQDIQHDADRYIAADGKRGQFIEQIRKGGCLIFYTHMQTLYGNGTKSGFRVFQIAIDRLKRHYGDRIQWMTGREIAEHFCPPPGGASRHDPEAAVQSGGYSYRIATVNVFGGAEWEEAREVIALADGSILVGGQTSSDDFPVTPGVVQEEYRGEPAGTGHAGLYGGDMFLTRFARGGTRLAASTYFGGSKQERSVYGMAVDREGNVLISTGTRSPDLPTTPGVYQRHYGGGPADMMVAKLSPDLGRLLWCTYIGRAGNDWCRGGLALDSAQNVYVVGRTNSPDFPVSENAYQRKRRGSGDAVVVKLSADGLRLLWATRLGGSGEETIMGVCIGGDGAVHIGGHTWSGDFPSTAGAPQRSFGGGQADAFFAGLSADGSRLLYATYLGGSANEFAEHRPALLDDGSVLLTGVTASPDFPTTAGAFQTNLRGGNDGFLVKLAPDRRRFAFSTLLGGSGANEFYLMPAVDWRGNIFIVGATGSPDFPVTAGAVQKSFGGGSMDGVFAVLSADGSKLLYATYLGGRGDELIRGLALGSNGEVYLVGRTNSPDFLPGAPGARHGPGGKFDAVLVQLAPITGR